MKYIIFEYNIKVVDMPTVVTIGTHLTNSLSIIPHTIYRYYNVFVNKQCLNIKAATTYTVYFNVASVPMLSVSVPMISVNAPISSVSNKYRCTYIKCGINVT